MTPVHSRVSLLLGAIIATLGVIVMASWLLQNTSIIIGAKTRVPMQFNTALGMFFGGLGLLTTTLSRRHLALFCGIGAAFLGGITLIEYILSANFGVDEFFVSYYIDVEISHPGRMAPNTALGFLLVGSVLILQSQRKLAAPRWVPSTLVSTVAALAAVAIFGYISGTEMAYGWADYPGMAIHTASGFLLTALGLLHQERVGSERRWDDYAWEDLVPIATAFVAIAIGLWQGLRNAETMNLERQVRLAGERSASLLSREMLETVDTFAFVGRRWQQEASIDEALWRADVRAMLHANKSLLAVTLVDAQKQTRWVVTSHGADRAFPPTRLDQEMVSRLYDDALGNGRAGIAHLEDMIILCVLLADEENRHSAMLAFHDQQAFFKNVRPDPDQLALRYSLHGGDGTELYRQGGRQGSKNPAFQHLSDVNILGRSWTLQTAATQETIAQELSALPWVVLLFVLGMGAMVPALIWSSKQSRASALRLDLLNKALQTEVEKLDAIITTSPNGIFLVNEKGIIVRANEEAERMFGYEKDELLGEPVEILIPMGKQERHRKYRRGFVEGESGRRRMAEGRELYGLRSDGTEIPIEVGLARVEGIEGAEVLVAATDITALRRHASKALAARTIELERSNAELEQFAYVASHDLQEPLRMISSYTSLLAKRYEGQLDDKADKYIRYAVDGAKRMKVLLEDLLALSRVGSRPPSIEKIELSWVVSKAIKNLEVAISEADAEITYDELPAIYGDAALLIQLFQNLIGNGIKFHRQGVAPKVKIIPKVHDDIWTFCVQDNGIGIPLDFQDRIFRVFQRLHARDAYPGSGMGLAIVKKIVERHGGNIWLESKEGEGTCFYFTLDAQPWEVQHDQTDSSLAS